MGKISERRPWIRALRFGTAQRLFLSFAALVTIFLLSSLTTLAHVRQIHQGLVDVENHGETVRLAQALASAVRDQYAHQAHTIILGNASHMGYYREAEERVLALTRELKAEIHGGSRSKRVAEIEAKSRELDSIFRDRIVPAVLAGRNEEIQREHDRAQLVVSRIQEETDALVGEYTATIREVEAQVETVRQATLRWTLLFLVGVPALAMVVGALVLRSVASPVALLSEGARRLSRGDLNTPIAVETRDEFGDLARQFNAMMFSLREHQERLVQSEKLAGIGRLAAGVAHEINNPLAVILGYTRLLKKRAEGSVREDLALIEEEALRSQEIVEGLLDLSRPMAGAPERVDLRQVCEEAIARLQDADQLAGIEVSVDGRGEILGRAQKLRQVMLNLLKNAAEAAGKGGRVEVGILVDDEGAKITVSDSGPGLGDEVLDKLFEPFFTTKASGVGLGLAVSQGIVRGHGGKISAGRGVLGGAEFTVQLPAAPREVREVTW